MYGGWGNTGHQRTIILSLALAGLLYLLFQTLNADNPRLSTWTNGQAVGQSSAGVAAASGGLSGNAEQQGRGLTSPPQGNPLGAPNTVMTQGYGVGSHAPAEAWGAIDLAIDSNGDGYADPDGSWDHPIYATQPGVIKVTPNSVPAGNHIWVTNDAYRTGYSHLSGFAVSDGQFVNAGDLIGYLGSTGQSSGPHLDYQVWEKQNGNWVNVNPLGYLVLP